jgi:hypothetical protein
MRPFAGQRPADAPLRRALSVGAGHRPGRDTSKPHERPVSNQKQSSWPGPCAAHGFGRSCQSSPRSSTNRSSSEYSRMGRWCRICPPTPAATSPHDHPSPAGLTAEGEKVATCRAASPAPAAARAGTRGRATHHREPEASAGCPATRRPRPQPPGCSRRVGRPAARTVRRHPRRRRRGRRRAGTPIPTGWAPGRPWGGHGTGSAPGLRLQLTRAMVGGPNLVRRPA